MRQREWRRAYVPGRHERERQAAMALDYIQEHYGNSELGLNQICEYLNISTAGSAAF